MRALIFSVALLWACQPWAGEIKVAVASNFIGAARALAEQFERQSDHRVKLVFGSTGKHYAQIKHGAPFDLFMAADSRRPELLEKEGAGVSGSRFTYAVGRLVLWSPDADLVDSHGKVLDKKEYRFLALANPKLAPYGLAAQQVLQSRELWRGLRGQMVRGENIGQAFQFVKSGNAELGFVAYSQIKQPGRPIDGSYWLVPQRLYQPIEQQAVLLKDNEISRNFLTFIHSREAQAIIQNFGYDIPEQAE